jgi:replication fork protection complex subunit Tof1/Swi1
MRYDDPVEIEDEEGESQLVDRRAVLEPAIRNVVSALGGVESGVYRLGDECYGCLKDLKKIWRKDDTDDDRTVARIFYEVRLLANDLIPILLATAGAGDPEDKRAIATADIMCAMTWPIDLAEELKELDEDLDARADFTQLLRSHLDYKRALLKPGVLQSLFSLTLPCLGRDVDADRAQKERDAQVIHLVLHVVRNLAFVKDPPVDAHASAEANQMSMLQGRLIRVLEEAHFFDLLVTIAANATADARFNAWNVTVLEILYLLSRGVKAEELAVPPAKVSLRPSIKIPRLMRSVASLPQAPSSSRSGGPAAARIAPQRLISTLAVRHSRRRLYQAQGTSQRRRGGHVCIWSSWRREDIVARAPAACDQASGWRHARPFFGEAVQGRPREEDG